MLEDVSKIYVTLGRAGSGKTLFTLWAFQTHVLKPWHEYRSRVGEKPKYLPIYIPLKNYKYEDYKHDLEKQKTYLEDALLRDYGLDLRDIINLKVGLGKHQQQILHYRWL